MIAFRGIRARSNINEADVPGERETTVRLNQDNTALVYVRCLMDTKRLQEMDRIRDLYFRGEPFDYKINYDIGDCKKVLRGLGHIERINIYYPTDGVVLIRIIIKVRIRDVEKDLVL